jgi:predicted phage terminase large subunit-like protein
VIRLTHDHVRQAKVELTRRHTADFACMVDIPTVPVSDNEDEERYSTLKLERMASHHKLLCDKLDGVENGTIPNLMVLMPPGSAKSTYVDVVFVPRFMALKPRRHVIVASYASNIAAKQGRRARQLIKSPSFYDCTGRSLHPDKTAADEWMLDNGSEYMAGGILSGLTGNRAALGVLDDPIRGREAAESETIREKTWEAYQDDFCSRLIPGAPQIMILTRWHQDDPAGRILPENWAGESGWFDGRDGRRWYVICLPAIADREDDPLGRKIGETLWPEWFNHEHWAPFKTNPRTWSSLYQQKPSPDEGTYFQREWFKRWKHLPLVHKYGTSDYATKDGSGDYTVHHIWGVDPQGDLYLIDRWRGQTTSNVWIERHCDLVELHKPLAWFGEAGPIYRAIEPALQRRMRERNAMVRMEPLPSISDKPTSARGFQSRAATGRVYLPDTPEGDAVLDELLRFPAGKYDDEVDACSKIGRALDDMHPAIVPRVNIDLNPPSGDYRPRRPANNGSAWG